MKSILTILMLMSLSVSAQNDTLRDTSYMRIETKLRAANLQLRVKSSLVKDFVQANDFNQNFCILIDMSIPSGKKRLFVYNIQKDSIEESSLVSHGAGSYKPDCNDSLIFLNLPNSFATSIGKYKIGSSYHGQYGLSYNLYGLDTTNNNAYSRRIVLHSNRFVPNVEVFPYHIYMSAGCPTVSPDFLTRLTKYIKTSNKPTLLWIYN